MSLAFFNGQIFKCLETGTLFSDAVKLAKKILHPTNGHKTQQRNRKSNIFNASAFCKYWLFLSVFSNEICFAKKSTISGTKHTSRNVKFEIW